MGIDTDRNRTLLAVQRRIYCHWFCGTDMGTTIQSAGQSKSNTLPVHLYKYLFDLGDTETIHQCIVSGTLQSAGDWHGDCAFRLSCSQMAQLRFQSRVAYISSCHLRDICVHLYRRGAILLFASVTFVTMNMLADDCASTISVWCIIRAFTNTFTRCITNGQHRSVSSLTIIVVSVYSISGIVAQYAHPIEHILSNVLPVYIGPLICGSHIATAWLWYALALFSTTISHCGYHFPFLPSPEAHDFHHMVYGVYLSVINPNLHISLLPASIRTMVYSAYSIVFTVPTINFANRKPTIDILWRYRWYPSRNSIRIIMQMKNIIS